MITAKIVRDAWGKVIGFTVENHGESIVCAAVSMLVLNTVNSIELLTEDNFVCDYDENGGYLKFTLTDPSSRTDGVEILLDAMVLGLTSARKEYPEEIEITETCFERRLT
ncbi:MAG: ribosomal-processing cysteine protease Prp [Defluviitaleaceae bacterium]|nr:ribosomal-processing cysteine protease Prp [Defluviitaleaceae bacterium]